MTESAVNAKTVLSFVDFLVQTKLIGIDRIHDLGLESLNSAQDIVHKLATEKVITQSSLDKAFSCYSNIEQIDLDNFHDNNKSIKNQLSEGVARKNSCCVIDMVGGSYVVAMQNPLDREAIDYITEILNAHIKPVLVSAEALLKYFNFIFKHSTEVPSLVNKLGVELHAYGKNAKEVDFLSAENISEAMAVKLLNEIIADAYHLNASDIHLESDRDSFKIRYRIDGVLYEQLSTSSSIANNLIRRLRVLANLDITHHAHPDDGRLSMDIDKNLVNMRVSIMPLECGQSVVIRFLGDVSCYSDLNAIIGDSDVSDLIRSHIKRSHGMLLIVGPTGSGKTTTQYASLMTLNRENKKIIAIEDPVEAFLPGVNQIPVNEKIDMGFASILRSTLRQDPDVIMIGEIREANTADIAMRASITGHMVLATLHTYDVMSAVIRLINLGVDSYVLADALHLLVSQRLLRKLCNLCKSKYVVTADSLVNISVSKELKKSLIGKTVYKNVGCKNCDFTGFYGRFGIFEAVEIDNRLKDLLRIGNISAFSSELQKILAKQSLATKATAKVLDGETSVVEVFNILHE
jgi:MSHA biogenesis protein MshE